MSLPTGTRIGAYDILAPIGAGGMGEVYRARDGRLSRDVAIKIVPPAVAANPDLLARFEREARAVAALSHPNILSIYDFGTSDGTTFAVMELLEGQSLRARLADGALPARKAVEVAVQIARGLAAAHDKGIVHRDLKPENIFLTSDTVKILDFGLARQAGLSTSATTLDSPTVAPSTEPGVVLGTVGYMAPEQVRAAVSDHRTDIFGLGCVLYEMLTGRRAFSRETAAETMTAILKEDPPDPATLGINPPPAVLRTLRRCLEKRPDDRFQSSRDLAFALESSLEASSSSRAAAVDARRDRRPLLLASLGLLAGLAVGAGAMALRPTGGSGAATAVAPTFRQITFENGIIRDARFTPDGQSVLYGAAWEGDPIRLFMTRTDSQESVRLALPDARLLSIAKTGEMAISLGHTFDGWMGQGTLARSSVLGSAPRPVLDQVREAEWNPDGTELAIVRRQEGFEQLEYPAGHVLYKTSGYISDMRFAPSGDVLAFADHPLFADDAGAVSLIDLAGKRTVLSEGYTTVRGLAWSRDGSEVWFSATKGGPSGGNALYAVARGGRERAVLAGPVRVRLYDVAPDGRVLLGSENADRKVDALLRGWTTARGVSLRANSTSLVLSRDGRTLLISDQSTPQYDAYLQTADSAAPVRLGVGQAVALSPDERWAAALPVSGEPVLIHPTGAGQTRQLPNPDHLLFDTVGWLDNQRLVLFGQKSGDRSRGYLQSLNGGPPTPFTPEGASITPMRWWALPIAADGRVVARSESGAILIFFVDGRPPIGVKGLDGDDVPIAWAADGQSLLVTSGTGVPRVVDRVDWRTGRRTRVLEVTARDKEGMRLSTLAVTPDAKYYVHSYSRMLTDLYVVEGLK